MTTHKTTQITSTDALTLTDSNLANSPLGTELNDLELDAIAGGTEMTTKNPLYQHLAEAAKKQGPVVNFKFHMATAVTLMGGKSASLESIFDPSKPLTF